jgi:osmoprotectant transport system permease protein
MTPGQQLRRVELPLALPVIVAGVRTAAVWTVGTATLSTPVGAPSLGNLIFAGLQTRNEALVVVGCVGAALLALGLDQTIGLLERGVRERSRARTRLALALLVAFVIAALSTLAGPAAAPAAPVRIGAKPFTEQFVLAELLAAVIERETGQPSKPLHGLGSTVLFDALRTGEIDVYVDYSGTLWATVLGHTGAPPPRAELLADVSAALSASMACVAAALGFENTYALALRRERAETLGVRRISELVPHAPALEIGGDYEWFQRAEWRALLAAYGLTFRATRTMDPTLMYAALAEGEVDVISAYSSDGRIAAFDLVLLEDDRAAIPPYDAVVLVSAGLVTRAPEVVAALQTLDGAIAADAMRRMNLAVDQAGRTPARWPASSSPRSSAPEAETSSALELGELVAVAGAESVGLGAGEAELLGDVRDLAALGARDGAVGGRHRVQALEQLGALHGRRAAPELARHRVVLGAAEQAGLRLRDLDHQVGLVGRQARQKAHGAPHLVGLGLRDHQVGVGDARQHEGEAGEEARRLGRQALELGRDLAHGPGLAGRGSRVGLGDAEEAQQGHRCSYRESSPYRARALSQSIFLTWSFGIPRNSRSITVREFGQSQPVCG